MNKKILLMVIFIFSFALFTMIFIQNYSENRSISKLNEVYANSVLEFKMNNIKISINEQNHVSEVISKMNIYDKNSSNYVERIFDPLIAGKFYDNVFVFNKERDLVYSSGVEFRDYKDFVNFIDGINFINKDFYYSDEKEIFYFISNNYYENLSGFFIWERSLSSIEKSLSIKNDEGDFYMIQYDGEIMIPMNFSEELDFTYESCINNEKIEFDGVVAYTKMINPDRCLFFVLPSNPRGNYFGDGFIPLLISCVVGFLSFFVLCMIRRFIKNKK